ncbi:MAG: DUF2817 domain-containing protein [Patescibacteria group bacterium]|jgi:hypothetical protein
MSPVFAATSVTYSSQAELESAISQTGSDSTTTPGALTLTALATDANPVAETRDVALLVSDDGVVDADIDFYLSAYFPNFDSDGDEAVDDVLEFADVDELSDLSGYEIVVTDTETTTQAATVPQDVLDAFATAGGLVIENIIEYSVQRQADTYESEVSFDYTTAAIRDLASDGTYLWTLDDTSPERILKIDPADGSTIATYCAPDTTPRGIEYVNNTLYIADSFADKLYELDPASLTVFDSVCAAPYEGNHYHFSDLSPVSGSPWGLASDGVNFYLVDSTTVRLHAFTISGSSLVQSNSWLLTSLTPRPATLPRGLAYNGGYLWYADSTTGLIYKLSPSDPSVTVTAYDAWDQWGSDEDPTGLAFIDGDLWVTDDDPTVKKLYNHSSFYLDKDSYEYFNKGNTSFETPSVQPKGLAYDGTYFWLADDYTNTIYKLNASTGAVVSSCIAPYSRPSGVAYYSGTLWVSDWGSDLVYLVNPTTCAVSSSWAAPSTGSHGIAHDGTNLWLADSDSDLIYKLNPTTGAVTSSFAAPGPASRGLAYEDGSLWVADETDETYYKLNPTDGSTQLTRTVVELTVEGIAFVDGRLWSVDETQDRIYNVDSNNLAMGQYDAPATNPRGFTTDGTNIWAVDSTSDKLYKLDDETWAVSATYDAPALDPMDITYGGGYLWITTDADNKIYKVDPATGGSVSSFATPDSDPYGLVYVDSYLYLTDTIENLFYKIDPTDGSNDQEWDAPGSSPGPLAYDGTSIWNFDTDERILFELELDDDVGGTISATQEVTTSGIQGIEFIGGVLYTVDTYFDMFFDADTISVEPTAIIEVADDYTSPYSVDDSFYYTTRSTSEGFFLHRRLGGVPETASRQILASSSRGGAVYVHEDVGAGDIFALDLVLLGDNYEVSRQTVPAVTLFFDALGIKIHSEGTQENTKPTYASPSTDLSNLMTSCSAAFVRTTIGTSSNGQPIYAYSYGTDGKPVAIYLSGVHGNEEHAYIPEVRWMQNLCTDYLAGTDRALNLFQNFEVIFVPLLNPYGIANGTRYNANYVDLNRNFDWNWSAYASSYKGASVFSEVESQAFRDLVLAHEDDLVFFNDAHAAMAIAPGMTWAYPTGAVAPAIIENVYDIFRTKNANRWFEEKAGLGRWLTYDRYTFQSDVPYIENWVGSLGIPTSTNEVMGKKDVGTGRMIHTSDWYFKHYDASFDALSSQYGRSVYRIDGTVDSVFSAAVTSNATTPAGTSILFRYGSNATTAEPTTWYDTYSSVPAGRYLFAEVILQRDAYDDSTPTLADFTVSYTTANTAPTVTTPTAVVAMDGSGEVTVATTLDDADDDDTLQALVEYSLNGGSSYAKATISELPADITATYGTPDVENDNTYQIGNAGGYITSSSGANALTFVWDAHTDAPTADISNAKIRVTPFDGTDIGTPVASSNITIDNAHPSGLATLSRGAVTWNSLTPTWDIASDSHFDHYEIWYGFVQADVDNRTGTAHEWDDSDDADLLLAATSATTIPGLSPLTNYYVKLFAVDTYGNESTIASVGMGTIKKSESTVTANVGGGGSGGGGSSNQITFFDIIQQRLPSIATIQKNTASQFLWTTSGTISFVNISYSLDQGATYEKIIGPTPNTGSYDWTTPKILSGSSVMFKIEATDLALIIDSEICEKNIASGRPLWARSPVTGELEEVTEVFPGDYIKSPYFSTVYYVTDDYGRRPFIDEETYFTWQESFATLKSVTDATLTTLTIAGPMLPKPGVKLVKIESDPRVYEVLENEKDPYRPSLRWISSEAEATERFGSWWKWNIVDVPVTTFARFDF